MGWEWRNGRCYYYTKKRIDGRVVSRYMGDFGAVTEMLRQEKAAEVKAERVAWQCRKAMEKQFDEQVDAACRELRQLRERLLLAAGYHQHKGQWRKKRMGKAQEALTRGEPQAATQLEVLRQAIKLEFSLEFAEKPSFEAQREYRELLEQHPEHAANLGDLVKRATSQLLSETWRSRGATRLSVENYVEQLKAEHGYETASLLEKTVIDEMALAWMRLYYVQEQQTAATHRQTGFRADHVEYWDRRVMYAQRRFLRACESLARVRKLAKGIKFMQVNIAQAGAQQANLVTRG
jgi:hypothetical protein